MTIDKSESMLFALSVSGHNVFAHLCFTHTHAYIHKRTHTFYFFKLVLKILLAHTSVWSVLTINPGHLHTLTESCHMVRKKAFWVNLGSVKLRVAFRLTFFICFQKILLRPQLLSQSTAGHVGRNEKSWMHN